MTEVFKKNFQVATCKHCGKVTDISMSGDVRKMVVQNITLKEQVNAIVADMMRLHKTKNGQIEAMHKAIAQLLGLMTPEQKEQAAKISQALRDEIKKIKKSLY